MLTKEILAKYRLRDMVLSQSDKDMTAPFCIYTPAGSCWSIEVEQVIISNIDKALTGQLLCAEYSYCCGCILLIWRRSDGALVELCLSEVAGVYPDSLYRTYAELVLPLAEHRALIDSFFEVKAATLVLKIALYATSQFQVDVWLSMLAIPCGTIVSYGDIARAVCHPKAFQAVGSAVGANPIALFIPCHRVVRSDSSLGQYMYGESLKERLLSQEFGLM